MENLRGKVDAQSFHIAGGGAGAVELMTLEQQQLITSQPEFVCSSSCQWNGMESEAAWLKFCVYMAMGNSSERNLLSSWSSSFVEMTNSIPA